MSLIALRRIICTLAALGLAGFGSAQIPNSWKSVGIGGGGAFYAPTFNPSNPSEMWLGCDMSGLYHSLDSGTSWTLVPFTTIQSGPYAPQMQYTSNQHLVYDVDTSNGYQTPVVSTDGGSIWNPIENDPTQQDAFYLLADPTTTTRLLVASYTTVYFSANAGKTWTKIVAGNNNSGVVLAGSYFNGQTIVVATSLGIYISKNGGSTFSALSTSGIPTDQQIVSFAAGTTGAITRFFAVTLSVGNIWGGIGGDNYGSYAGVYVLDYGTANPWKKSVNGIPSSTYPFFVAMARNDANDVYLAGSCNAGTPIVMKSSNGGGLWSEVLNTGSTQNVLTGWQGYGGDHQWTYDQLVFGFTVCPTNSKLAAFTGYGFCHITTSGGLKWQQVYVNPANQNAAGAPTPKKKAYGGIGLENTSCWWVAWPKTTTTWASFTDIGGIRSTNGGNTWSFNYSGLSVNTTYEGALTASGTMYVATSSIHDMYQSTHLTDASIDSGTGQVMASTDGGATWTQVGSIEHVVMDVALDPTNAQRAYTTVASSTEGGVYVCNNLSQGTKATWTRLPAPPRTQGHAFNVTVLNDGTVVATFSGRRTTNFTDSSGVFVSTNHGETWEDRSTTNMDWWTMDLTVAPTDSKQNTWYVGVYSGWGGAANNRGGLYKTTNRGQTWSQIWNTAQVGSCTVDPNSSNLVYATTQSDGLWASTNAQSASPTFVQIASYPFMEPTRVFFNPLKKGEVWVTSFGNGLRIGEQTGP